MQSTKFEIAIEHISHLFSALIVVGVCGMFLPAVLLVLGGGELFVEKLNAPLLDAGIIASKVMYGCLSYLAFTVITKAWLIEGCLDHWQERMRHYRMDIDRMKNGPLYFRR